VRACRIDEAHVAYREITAIEVLDAVGARNPIVASGGVPILVDQAVASGEMDEPRDR
jgi:hypothetical protein